MEKSKIERINRLARKSKAEGLTLSEKEEQKRLRDEYRSEFRASLISQLESITVVDIEKEEES